MTNRSTRGPIRALALAAALLTVGLLAPAQAAADLTCERVPELLRTYLQKHISFHYLNDELRQRTVKAYIKRLDPSKTLLLADEKAALETRLQGVFHDIRTGDCSALLELQKDMLARYEANEAFVREYVSRDDYELDTSVELIIDPEKRGHPRDEAARDDLYRRLVHFQMSNYLSNGEELEEAKRKLIHRYELMTKRAGEVEEPEVYGTFLDAFATALDPHSNYLLPEAAEDFQIGMDLSLDGIGVALSSRDGYSVVEKIIPGGAADKVKLLEPGDKIIAVAQAEGSFVDIIDMKLRDVVRLIRGKRGTQVHLTVLRPKKDTTERMVVTIVRDKIDLEDQAAQLRFEEVEVDDADAEGGKRKLKLAILELPSFYGGRNPTERQSSRDVRDLLAKVRQEKADGLLLDLSRNGGGLLENSVEIAGFFIRTGGVVAVRDTFSKVQVLRDPDDSILFNGPMVVLISRVSASASEIVAGAMKDYARAVIVGDDHTFGKGTVQSMVPLPRDLGALKVTTALFFRPGGSSTQHEGVLSDISFPSIFAINEVGERHQEYSLPTQRIDGFVEPSQRPAALTSDASYWSPVTEELVVELSKRSAERTGADEGFDTIREQIQEAEERAGVLRISDIYTPYVEAGVEADATDGEGEAAKDGPRTASREPSPDLDPSAASDAPSGAAPESGDIARIDESPETREEAEGKPTPQQLEALQILADLVSLGS